MSWPNLRQNIFASLPCDAARESTPNAFASSELKTTNRMDRKASVHVPSQRLQKIYQERGKPTAEGTGLGINPAMSMA